MVPAFSATLLDVKVKLSIFTAASSAPANATPGWFRSVQSSRLAATAGSDQIAVQVKGVLHATSPSIPYRTKEKMKWACEFIAERLVNAPKL